MELTYEDYVNMKAIQEFGLENNFINRKFNAEEELKDLDLSLMSQSAQELINNCEVENE